MTNYNIANLGCVIIPLHQFIMGILVAVYVGNYDIPKFGLKLDVIDTLRIIYVYLED